MEELWKKVIEFYGYECLGLVIGFKVVFVVKKYLGCK